MPTTAPASLTDAQLADLAEHAFARNDWDAILDAARGLSFDAQGARGRFFDAVSFALTQKKRLPEAIALARQLQTAPTRMRNVSWAYVLYLALLSAPPELEADRQALERDFLAAAARVLEDDPSHITTLYRLATFYAEVASARDKKALELYLRAVTLYERLDPAVRQQRHTFFKPYVKSLYGGARSALRIGAHAWAHRLIGRCLRVDADTNHVAPLFKLYLAAQVLAAEGQWPRAEKGYRLALAAEGPRDRAFVHDRLAAALAAQGDVVAAIAWLDQHVPAHRRPGWIWMHAGDLERQRDRLPEARRAWEAALRGDRSARHLVLCRLGELDLHEGRVAPAKRRFLEALQHRKKRHQVADRRALKGLLACARAENDDAEVARIDGELAQLERADGRRRSA